MIAVGGIDPDRYRTVMRLGLLSSRLVAALQKSEKALRVVTEAGGAGLKLRTSQVKECREELEEAVRFLANIEIRA